MSVTYQNLKCTSCGSTKFKPVEGQKNIWVCEYCGTKMERREEHDTLFGIKNVVRQVLVDVSYRRFPEAETKLTESAMIDSGYVGTCIARICYYMNMAVYGKVTEQERNNMVAQVKRYHRELLSFGDMPTEEEIALYEFIDSAEAFGTLILAYDTLGCRARVDAVIPFFNPAEVYSMSLNANLLKYMVEHKRFEIADGIVKNYDNLDKHEALCFLLFAYPDNEQKIANCTLLLEQGALLFDDRTVMEEYLEKSADAVPTKFHITCAALKTDAAPSVRCVMSCLIPHLTAQEEVKAILDLLLAKKLGDSEIYTVIEYALEQCPQETALYIMQLFKENAQFVVLKEPHFISLLENKSITNEYKQKIIDVALTFKVTDKTREQFVSYYLNHIAEPYEQRVAFLDYLFALIPSLSTVSAEKYILSPQPDGEHKAEIVKKIFALEVNQSFFRETFDKYVSCHPDPPAVTDAVAEVLAENGLRLSENVLAAMLVQDALSQETKLMLLRRMKNGGARYLSLTDKYLQQVPVPSYSGYIMEELADMTDSVSATAVTRYLLEIRDEQTVKSVTAKKLADKCKIPFLTQNCRTQHANAAIECTALQAYILITPDSPDTACAVLQVLGAAGYKLNSDILVAGSRKKFKKYLNSVRDALSPASTAAATALGLL